MAHMVIDYYCKTHQRIFDFLNKLTDEQLHWRANDRSHSLAWQGWHVARWADYFQACIPAMTPELSRLLEPGVQIWIAENLADAWGYNKAQLGYAETGMYMSDEVALAMTFPAKAQLMDYVGRSIDVAIHVVSQIDEQQFDSMEQPQPLTEGIWGESTVGDAIMAHLTHSNRHLGMMECLLGLQGQPGTATI